MGIAGSRDCRDEDCSDGDRKDEDIRVTVYRDGHHRGSKDRDHSDAEVSVHLVRQMKIMLKGTISGKMAPKGAWSRQLVNGGRALEASFGGGLWSRSVALLRLFTLSSPPALLVLDQEPLGGGWCMCRGSPGPLKPGALSSFPASFRRRLSWGHCACAPATPPGHMGRSAVGEHPLCWEPPSQRLQIPQMIFLFS